MFWQKEEGCKKLHGSKSDPDSLGKAGRLFFFLDSRAFLRHPFG